MFTEQLWNEWVQREIPKYKIIDGKPFYEKKNYIHFDHKFWFPERQEELKVILKNELRYFKGKINRTEYWSFTPFIKVLIRTPRFRYQVKDEDFGLEFKVRPISYASHFDSLIFSFYSFCLSKVYENYIKEIGINNCVLAYRSDLGLSNIQFAKEIFEQIRKRKECTAIALDIKGYFDNIDHSILKSKWKKIQCLSELPDDQYYIFKAITKYSYINRSSLLKNFKDSSKPKKLNTLFDLVPGNSASEKYKILREKKLIITNQQINKKTKKTIGIPQGSSISALLSNIYLVDFDRIMHEKSLSENFIYRRYCDDIIIICDTQRATEMMDFAITLIHNEYNLTIQKSKVEMIDFHMNSYGIQHAFKRIPGSKNKVQNLNANKFLKLAETNRKNEKLYYKNLQYLGFEFNGRDILIRSSSLSKYYRKMKARIVKTISMAYSPKSKSLVISKRQLFEKYTHLGGRNFIAYALNASKPYYTNSSNEIKEGMDSKAIRRQISRHFNILFKELHSKNAQRIHTKSKSKKPVKINKLIS